MVCPDVITPHAQEPGVAGVTEDDQPGLLMEPYPAGGTWEVRDAMGCLRCLAQYQDPTFKRTSRKIISVCIVLMQPLQRTSCTEIAERQEAWGGRQEGKRRGRLFRRSRISDRFGESCIPVSLPSAWSELFLTCTLECRTVSTISIKSHGKQTFWCGWYLFAGCRQVDLIRTAFTTFAKRFETG